MSATVSQVWRYPVKAVGGERLPSAEVDDRGLAGDRWWAVVTADGGLGAFKNSQRFRRLDALAELSAATAADGVRINHGSASWHVEDPDLAPALSGLLGAEVHLAAEDATPHFDAHALSLVGTATLDWCAEHLDVDADPRRLRSNLLVATDEPFEEERWTGEVRIGAAVLRPVERIVRCRTIDLEQNGARGTTPWLKALGGSREACLGVYLDVITPGVVSESDQVEAS